MNQTVAEKEYNNKQALLEDNQDKQVALLQEYEGGQDAKPQPDAQLKESNLTQDDDHINQAKDNPCKMFLKLVFTFIKTLFISWVLITFWIEDFENREQLKAVVWFQAKNHYTNRMNFVNDRISINGTYAYYNNHTCP